MPLDPETEAHLRALAAFPLPPPAGMTAAAYRRLTGQFVFQGAPTPVARIADFTLPGPATPVPVRLYVPSGNGVPPPVLVYFHGGGWVLCGLDSHDELCRRLAVATGWAVLAVDYRLAPEAPFPAGLEDCFAALAWAAAHGGDHGLDGSRLAVCGDSAGGNLAAAVALLARERGGPRLCHQILVYPVTDADAGEPVHETHGLTRAGVRWTWTQYLPAGTDGRTPLASPLHAPDLAGLPPATVLTAEYDPLRAEGEAYGRRLEQAVPGSLTHRVAGAIHGFFGRFDSSGRSAAAMALIARRLQG